MPDRDPVNVRHTQARKKVKVRRGFVLASGGGWSLVAMGTSQIPGAEHQLLLEPNSRDGKSLNLTDDTYFHGELMEWFRDAEVKRRKHSWPCSNQTFKRLRAIFQHEVLKRPALAEPPSLAGSPSPTPSGPIVQTRPRRRSK